jgi:hypothetical protein
MPDEDVQAQVDNVVTLIVPDAPAADTVTVCGETV